MARRAVRVLTWGLGGVALGVALLLLVLNIVARTQRGHEFVLGRTLSALGKNLNGGKLIVERIDGNLFEGAKLYGLRLQDRQGRAFVVADSAFLNYTVSTLVSPRIHITKATLYDPEIYIFKLPGDSLWNYQAIFSNPKNRDPNRPRVERATLLDTIRVINGMARLQTPWEPDSTLGPAARRAELAEALSDTSLVLIDQAPGGYIRTMNFTALNGRISRVRFAPGTTSGSIIHVDSLRGVAQIFRKPVQFNQIQGRWRCSRATCSWTRPCCGCRDPACRCRGWCARTAFPPGSTRTTRRCTTWRCAAIRWRSATCSGCIRAFPRRRGARSRCASSTAPAG